MMRKCNQTSGNLCLGIECGGTKTTAILAEENGREIFTSMSGPANLRLLNDSALVAHFKKIRSSLKDSRTLKSVAIGMAGARTEADRNRIHSAVAKVWPSTVCYVTNDLETALTAAATP